MINIVDMNNFALGDMAVSIHSNATKARDNTSYKPSLANFVFFLLYSKAYRTLLNFFLALCNSLCFSRPAAFSFLLLLAIF